MYTTASTEVLCRSLRPTTRTVGADGARGDARTGVGWRWTPCRPGSPCATCAAAAPRTLPRLGCVEATADAAEPRRCPEPELRRRRPPPPFSAGAEDRLAALPRAAVAAQQRAPASAGAAGRSIASSARGRERSGAMLRWLLMHPYLGFPSSAGADPHRSPCRTRSRLARFARLEHFSVRPAPCVDDVLRTRYRSCVACRHVEIRIPALRNAVSASLPSSFGGSRGSAPARHTLAPAGDRRSAPRRAGRAGSARRPGPSSAERARRAHRAWRRSRPARASRRRRPGSAAARARTRGRRARSSP